MEPIRTYHVFRFDSAGDAEDARLRITQLLTTPSGAKYLKDDPAKRAVILSGPPTTLYISPGSLEAATILWVNLPTSTVVRSSDLPRDLSLLFGATGDLPR